MKQAGAVSFADRSTRLSVAVCGTLVLSVFLCYFLMDDARSAAADSATSFAACDEAATTIESLRQRSMGPVLAGGVKPMEEVTRRIEAAASASGLPPRDLKTVSPQQPQRIADSPFSEVPTQIEIGDATLAQTTAFTGELCDSGGGLRLSSIHLSAAPGTSMGKQANWTTDLTVAYITRNGPTDSPRQ